MFALKLETLSLKENAVVLSAAVTYFDIDKKYTFDQLVNDTLFVKFSVEEQSKKYHRDIDPNVIKFWKGQPESSKELSLIPSENDDPVTVGIGKINRFIEQHTDAEEFVFTRGYFSQLIFTNLCNNVKMFPSFKPRQYMDFKTAIQVLKDEANNGIIILPELPLVTSNPIHENVKNILMLLS